MFIKYICEKVTKATTPLNTYTLNHPQYAANLWGIYPY